MGYKKSLAYPDIKRSLLQSAALGEDRPKQTTTYLGKILSRFTSVKSMYYDAAFHAEIKALRPDWFKKPSHGPQARKDAILRLAYGGMPRSSLTHELNNSLNHYMSATPSHDAAFEKLILELRPDWFNRTRVAQNKEAVRTAAMEGGDKPSFAYMYLRPSGSHYDEAFSNEINALRPEWFIHPATLHGTSIKERLIAMAQAGEDKPAPSRDKELFLQWRRYWSKPDDEFLGVIRAIRPDWLVPYSHSAKRRQRQ